MIGETSHLPPTLLAQFYAPQLGPVRGYLGAGVNYTLFFDDSIDDAVVSPLLGGADVDVKLSNSVGFAWEVGRISSSMKTGCSMLVSGISISIPKRGCM